MKEWKDQLENVRVHFNAKLERLQNQKESELKSVQIAKN